MGIAPPSGEYGWRGANGLDKQGKTFLPFQRELIEAFEGLLAEGIGLICQAQVISNTAHGYCFEPGIVSLNADRGESIGG